MESGSYEENRNLERSNIMAEYLWMPFGIASIIFSIISLIQNINKKSKNSIWFTVVSLSLTALFVVMQYQMIDSWLQGEDFSALLDVVPIMSSIVTIYVILVIIINIFSVYLYIKEANKREK